MAFPRSSQLGYYFVCDLRALKDRSSARSDTRNAPADFGTVTHFHLMNDTLGIPVKPYSAEILTSALKWDTIDMALKVAEACKHYFDGDEWDCEYEFNNGIWTGHIDFLNKKRTRIIDFKTTSKGVPPAYIEWHYLWQQLAYATEIPTVETIEILYAHSHGNWTHLAPAYKVTEEHRNFVRQKMFYLHSKELEQYACPNPGEHCKKTWCPYLKSCHDKLAPALGGQTKYNHKPVSLGFFNGKS